MHTPDKAAFASTRRHAARSALSLLGVLALACSAFAGTAAAQPAPGAPPSPFGPPTLPPGAQTPPGAQAPPGAPSNPFGPAPSTPFGGPGAPGMPGMQPGEQPIGEQPPAAGPEQPPAGPVGALSDEEQRYLALMEHVNLMGSTGLLHTSYAGSGPAGTFRVGFISDWFSSSGFLCREDAAYQGVLKGCKKSTGSTLPATDKASRVGGTFVINATPLSFLEAYALLRTYATSDDQGRPTLLQVLGDTTLGVKAFNPPKLGQIFTYGGELQLLLLNGTGGVGVSGAGTSARLRGLVSADFRKADGGGVPIRVNFNLGWHIDNSGKLVEDVERARGKAAGLKATAADPGDADPAGPRLPISRIERFGLGINRVDTIETYLGVEAPLKYVQPFVEWSVDIPANRQGYYCHTGRLSNGDVCLGLSNPAATGATAQTTGGPGFKAVPSRFTLGARTSPLPEVWRGLSAMVAFDIGTSGTSTFVEEMAPQAPWSLYIGLGFAYDAKKKEAPAAPPAPPPQIVNVPAPQLLVRGFVHEAGKNDAVHDAIVHFEGNVQAPVATGADGKFVTRNLEPGSYKFNVKHHGFKPTSCIANVTAGGAPPAAPPAAPAMPGAPASPFGAPPASPFGAPPAAPFGAPPAAPPGAPGAPPAGVPGMPPALPPAAPQGPVYVDIDCPMEALPRLGGIIGSIRDGESNAPVPGAVAKLTLASGKDVTVTADGSGVFTVKDLHPGPVVVRAEASGYFSHTQPVEVRASEDARPTVQINKRPKQASVKVQGNEIKLSKQIHFETDSAKIMGDSNSLMEEIADVLQRSQGLKKVEIQGHTDNTGSRDHNQQLSDARAQSVKAWLVGAGIDAGRLTAKGYGQDRPLAPNVTAANRGKNRRVQFMILEGK